MSPDLTQRQAHQSLWLEDGSVVLSIENALFKVHRSMLTRLSPFFRSRLSLAELKIFEGLPLLQLEVGIANSCDVAALLEHLYHDKPLINTSSFGQTARIIRAATQFQFQELRNQALCRLEGLYPRRPLPFEYANWQYLHEATQVALDCEAREVLPALLYAMVTTSDFEVEENSDDRPPTTQSTLAPEISQIPREELTDDSRGRSISKQTTQLCVTLMNNIMNYFSPILFTVPTSSHMECTGVFADHWMEYAIQPSLDDSGVYKPLETLKKIQAVDWSSLGLCDACCVEKWQEWDEVAGDIWSRIEGWANLDAFFAVLSVDSELST